MQAAGELQRQEIDSLKAQLQATVEDNEKILSELDANNKIGEENEKLQAEIDQLVDELAT